MWASSWCADAHLWPHVKGNVLEMDICRLRGRASQGREDAGAAYDTHTGAEAPEEGQAASRDGHPHVHSHEVRLTQESRARRLNGGHCACVLVSQVLPWVPVNQALPQVPVNQALPRVPVNQALPQVPVNQVFPRVPVNQALPRVPVNQCFLCTSQSGSSLGTGQPGAPETRVRVMSDRSP